MGFEALEAMMLVEALEAAGDLNIPVAHHFACHQPRRQAASVKPDQEQENMVHGRTSGSATTGP